MSRPEEPSRKFTIVPSGRVVAHGTNFFEWGDSIFIPLTEWKDAWGLQISASADSDSGKLEEVPQPTIEVDDDLLAGTTTVNLVLRGFVQSPKFSFHRTTVTNRVSTFHTCGVDRVANRLTFDVRTSLFGPPGQRIVEVCYQVAVAEVAGEEEESKV